MGSSRWARTPRFHRLKVWVAHQVGRLGLAAARQQQDRGAEQGDPLGPLYLSLAYRIWPVELAGNPLLTIVLWPPATCLAILSIRPSDGGMVFGFVLADAVIFGAVSVAMGLLAYKVRHIDRVSPWLCVCLSALTLGGFVFLGGILVDAARRRQPSPRRLLLLHNEFCRAIGASSTEATHTAWAGPST